MHWAEDHRFWVTGREFDDRAEALNALVETKAQAICDYLGLSFDDDDVDTRDALLTLGAYEADLLRRYFEDYDADTIGDALYALYALLDGAEFTKLTDLVEAICQRQYDASPVELLGRCDDLEKRVRELEKDNAPLRSVAPRAEIIPLAKADADG
jgi:hypothetical protein